MKLIIDISDHLYNVIKNKECTDKNVLTKAVENGTPLTDVLGKIKTEIESQREEVSNSWSNVDEWRERQAEERQEKEEALMGTPCLGCFYSDKCDYAYAYEDCELCEYDEQEEVWERF